MYFARFDACEDYSICEHIRAGENILFGFGHPDLSGVKGGKCGKAVDLDCKGVVVIRTVKVERLC